MNNKILVIVYVIFLSILTIYSYSLIDPNLTLINHPLWPTFRDPLVYFGYYQRQYSWYVYSLLILLLFIFNYFFEKRHKSISPLKISILTAGMLLFSYPFLSHDFFNYLFDAKIATFYGQNPYLKTALDFPTDPWIRFMHWTHRTYPYGPVFLLISFIPSFMSFGKFILSYAFFKGMFLLFYIWTVKILQQKNKQWAIQFATHPLVIIEGLLALHNDLIALCLGIIGILYVLCNERLKGRISLLLSFGIKYITLPVCLLIWNKNKKIVMSAFLLQVLLLVLMTVKMEIQPWYFLNLIVFIPFTYNFLKRLQIFFMGLLLSYYPYIVLGGWYKKEFVEMKHTIIWIFFALNVAYLVMMYIKLNQKKGFSLNGFLFSEEHISDQT